MRMRPSSDSRCLKQPYRRATPSTPETPNRTESVLQKHIGAVTAESPIGYNGHSITQKLRFVDVVRDQYKSNTRLFHLFENIDDIALCAWVHSGCRLVEQDDLKRVTIAPSEGGGTNV